MKKINKSYSYKVSWIPKDSDWVEKSLCWDGQWFYEIFFGKKKVGEAAFVDAESSSFIAPCDFCDLAIEIDPKHQRKGLASFLIKDVSNRCKKPLWYNPDTDHTPAGLSFLKKMKIPVI